MSRSERRSVHGQRTLTAGTALAVVVVDQVTKALIVRTLAVGASVRVLGPVLSFTRVDNTGAAFGLLPGAWPVLAIFAAILAGVLVYVSGRSGSRRVALALGLVLGGAVGNLIDRALRHDVIDFVNVHVWPVFNVADAAVTVGAAALLVLALTGATEPEEVTAGPSGSGRNRQEGGDAGPPET